MFSSRNSNGSPYGILIIASVQCIFAKLILIWKWKLTKGDTGLMILQKCLNQELMKLQGPDSSNYINLCRPHRVSSISPHSPSVRLPHPQYEKTFWPLDCTKTGYRPEFAGAYFKLIFSVTKELTWVDGCCFGRVIILFSSGSVGWWCEEGFWDSSGLI